MSGPLQILLCISGYRPVRGGAERQTELLARELAGRGHAVEVLTRHIAGQPARETVDGVVVRREVRPVPLGPLFGLTFLRGMRRGAARTHPAPTIVQAQQGLWEAAAIGPLARRPGWTTCVRPANSGAFGEVAQLQRTRFRAWLWRAIASNTGFVAINGQVEAELVARGIEGSRITRVTNAVEIPVCPPAVPLPLRESASAGPHCVFVGRLEPQKNVQLLIAVWHRLSEHLSGTLWIVGEGSQRGSLEVAAAQGPASRHIRFVGAVPDAIPWIAACDCILLPSLSEGVSNALLEAMALARPAIVSDIPGNRELVCAGAGLAIDPLDEEAWCRGLLAALGAPEQRAEWGRKAREIVKDRHSVGAVTDSYLEVWDRLRRA